MCTLSVLPLPDGVLVAMNRDERRTRPLGGALTRRRHGDLDIAHPTDVEAGGTWFGVNSAGLVAAVLNNYAAAASLEPRPRSRGEIPWTLLEQPALEPAWRALQRFDLALYRPFRAVLIDQERICFAESDGSDWTTWTGPLAPWLLVSSGRTEDEVRAWRARRFEAFLAQHPERAADPMDAIRRLHFEAHPTRPELGFSMARPEARSVSYTEAELRADGVRLRHLEEPPRDYNAARAAQLDRSTVILAP